MKPTIRKKENNSLEREMKTNTRFNSWAVCLAAILLFAGCDAKLPEGGITFEYYKSDAGASQKEASKDAPLIGGDAGFTKGETGSDGCRKGSERCECYANGTCDAGLQCLSGICVEMSQDGGTSPVDGGVEDVGDDDDDEDVGDDDDIGDGGEEDVGDDDDDTGDAGETDTGTDAGEDAGADAGEDAGADAGEDAGTDAGGIDGGTDAGDDDDDDDDDDTGDPPCYNSSQCDVSNTQGYVCNGQRCVKCLFNNDCSTDLYYGNGATCNSDGRCQKFVSCNSTGCSSGKVCDEASGLCRNPYTCLQMNCAAHQLCEAEAPGKDAKCLEECEWGWVWNQLSNICDEVYPNCRENRANSILNDCLNVLRRCVETDEDAYCGNCFAGYIETEAGVCRPIVTCQTLNCDAANRLCVPEGEESDAFCGSCKGGYIEKFGECEEIPNTTCDASPAPGSILDQCDSEHRVCVPGAPAVCGECKTGYFENSQNGLCEPQVTCAQLKCAAKYRDCAEPTPTTNGQCLDCKENFEQSIATGECICKQGYLLNKKDGVCEPIRTCMSGPNSIAATCAALNENCIEHGERYHAYCSKCGYGQAYYKFKEQCIPCPPCARPGQTGRVWPIASQQGHCVCETMDGYFHTESGTGGTLLCDADGDGWITQEARLTMEMEEGTAEKDNARCDLRLIDRFVLKNDMGQTREVLLSDFDFLIGPVPLYEPANRDRPDKLVYDYSFSDPARSNYAPKYGNAGRTLKAEELNPLTKACAPQNPSLTAQYADYNANGVPDIDELGANDEDEDPERRTFNIFSYYLETHRGWYENPEASEWGRYVIEEKSRIDSLQPGLFVNFKFGDNPKEDYWRSCKRFKDEGYDPQGAQMNFDFANYYTEEGRECVFGDKNSWCGMTHHSQFKCLMAVQANKKNPDHPNYLTRGEITAWYSPNLCASYGSPNGARTPDEPNPKDPSLNCQAMGNNITEDAIVWGIANYRDYEDPYGGNGAYVRGCINECAEQNLLEADKRCKGPQNFEIKCNGLEDNFGKLFCYMDYPLSDVPNAPHQFCIGSSDNGLTAGYQDCCGVADYRFCKPFNDFVPPDDPDFCPVPIGCPYAWETGRKPDEAIELYDGPPIENLQAGVLEVSQDQFEDFMGYNPSRFYCDRAICPVESVTICEAAMFANRISEKLGYRSCYQIKYIYCQDGTEVDTSDPDNPYYERTDYNCEDRGGILSCEIKPKYSVNTTTVCNGYRIPNEFEWEYVARANSDFNSPATAYYNGPIDPDKLDCKIEPVLTQAGWYCGNAGFGTRQSALLTPNAWGLYDIAGNVGEYIDERWYDGTNSASYHVHIRGGAWNKTAQDARVAARIYRESFVRSYGVGFRLVRTNWEPDPNKYKFYDTPKKWTEARDICAAEVWPDSSVGGHLVVINDAEENELIRKIAKLGGSNNFSVWIGYSDLDGDNIWEWESGGGHSTYTNWEASNPKVSSNPKYGLLYPADAKWYGDHYGDFELRFVCEKNN